MGAALEQVGLNKASTDRPIFRFAPSPNGFLHLGHAYSALTSFERAAEMGGQFLLRIEDIDPGRSRDDYVAAIYEDLRWLGLSWAEPVLRQSERLSAYQIAIDHLHALGVLYPCAATRGEIRTASAALKKGLDPDGAPLYPGRAEVLTEEETKARVAAGKPHALRLDMEKACGLAKTMVEAWPLAIHELQPDGKTTTRSAEPQRWGDAVIVRKDVPTSYHLAVVVDDGFQNVSHVTRGQDLYAATDIQRLLQVLLGISPPIYVHHPLILDASGKKLSKSDNSTSLKELRETGHTPQDIQARIAENLDLQDLATTAK